MPTDKLEDFILNHREDFDSDAPVPDLWSGIEDALEPEEEDGEIESFIATHREEFDDATPPPKVEALIFRAVDLEERKIAPSPLRVRSRKSWHMMGLAASAMLLIVAAFLLGNNRGYRLAETDLVSQELERIAPEYLETERYFKSEIATQTARVRQVSTDPELMGDLEEIDRATAEVRASLLEVPASQRPVLIDELIQMHRTKLGILTRLQRHLPPSPTGGHAAPQIEKSHEL